MDDRGIVTASITKESNLALPSYQNGLFSR